MQYVNSDLEHLVPLWERKLPNVVNQPVRKRLRSRDIDVLGSPIGEDSVGDIGTFAQDRLRARIIRQGSIKRALK